MTTEFITNFLWLVVLALMVLAGFAARLSAVAELAPTLFNRKPHIASGLISLSEITFPSSRFNIRG
ncbi:MAG: hypothetical protein NZ750_06530 [Anaerolineae bacterium]|nr:hypothetical protein [Anaerolineae bacterium]MDW8171144.1 hypothetical protein [Anaerolineae bacterium]